MMLMRSVVDSERYVARGNGGAEGAARRVPKNGKTKAQRKSFACRRRRRRARRGNAHAFKGRANLVAEGRGGAERRERLRLRKARTTDGVAARKYYIIII